MFKKLKLWVLEPILGKSEKSDNIWDYDCKWGFVVCAETESHARKIANENSGYENRNGLQPWINSLLTTCKELKPIKAGLIISDFRSG